MNPAELIINNQGKIIKVSQVKVEGISKTNDQFLLEITKPLLEATTLGEAIVGSRNIAHRLQKFDIFKNVQVGLEADPNVADGLIVVFNATEAPRLYAHTGADFGSHEGSMNVSLKVRNVFGNGETLSGKTSYGVNAETNRPSSNSIDSTKDNNSMQDVSANEIVFTKPLFGDPDTILHGSIYKWERNHTSLMSFQERIRGFSLKYKSSWSECSRYEVGYDLVWRHNLSLSPSASLGVRNDAGHSLKSSISQEYNLDTRNDHIFPSNGLYLKIFQELAGIGGDVSFFKFELQTSKSLALPLGSSLTFSSRGGILKPIPFAPGFRNSSMINDRFQLGGPTSLRGFAPCGVGLKEKDDALGGNTYVALGANLMFPIPYLPPSIIRGHSFVNGGVLLPSIGSFKDFHPLKDSSIAAGIGLIVRFTSFRLELNYCVPLLASPSDRIKPGFQFGIGMHFM